MKRLITATALSQVGTEVTSIALPLSAILVLGATPFQVGLLYAAEYLPLALVGLVAGAWVDRIRRRRLMVVADFLRAGLLGTVPVAYLLGHLSLVHLYAVAIAVGLLSVLFDAAKSAFVPSLVKVEELTTANSRLQIAEQGAGIVGPSLGGLLTAAFGAPLALAVDAVSYMASGGLVSAITSEDRVPEEDSPERGLLAAIWQGLRFVLVHPVLRSITASASLTNLFGRMISAVLVVYLARSAGLSAFWIGVVMSAGSVGFVIGALAAPKVAQALGRTTAVRAGSVIASASFLLIALPPPRVAGLAAAVGLFVYGAGALLFTVNATTFRQLLTPDSMLGRVSTVARVLSWGTIPIASAIGGGLASLLGIRQLLLLAAIGALTASLPVLLTRFGPSAQLEHARA